MLNIKIQRYEDLSEDERENVSNNGAGKEYARYLRVTNDEGDLIALESDAMEPEDAIFSRDLSWIPDLIIKCYELGRCD